MESSVSWSSFKKGHQALKQTRFPSHFRHIKSAIIICTCFHEPKQFSEHYPSQEKECRNSGIPGRVRAQEHTSRSAAPHLEGHPQACCHPPEVVTHLPSCFTSTTILPYFLILPYLLLLPPSAILSPSSNLAPEGPRFKSMVSPSRAGEKQMYNPRELLPVNGGNTEL